MRCSTTPNDSRSSTSRPTGAGTTRRSSRRRGRPFFEDYALLFPHPYDTEVKAGAKLSGLPPALIYATLRQESLYRSDAVSGAGALGLLQLRLETARMVRASANGRRADALGLFFDPAINVPLGAAELRTMLDRFDTACCPSALAAYNAGPGAAARWLPPSARGTRRVDREHPYNETRTYVQRVLWHSVVFAWLATARRRTRSPGSGKIGTTEDHLCNRNSGT
jgi:soluble lytic murein transglycosylase